MKRFKVLSLAALVAFAACDEGTEPVVAPPVTGTISGVVTIEGTARSGVSVTLSSGAAATTDASGAYSFAGVAAGTYTVTISGFPTDVTFSTTTKGATIATSGQVATVNFDGAYVRTAAILGAVAAGGKGLSGVKVTLTGTNAPTSPSVNTDANGQYAFTGLRAGTYTVTMSGFDATQYAFASATASITVGVGQTQVASFNGTLLATSKITGTVKIDGAAAAGVKATLTPGGATATTDAAGAYTFSNLAAGTYTVTISDYPADAQFTAYAQSVTITSAGSTVNANFDGAYIKTSSIVGTVAVAGTPLAGVKVTVGSTSVNTDTNGQYSFAGLRAGTYTVTISGWDATMYTFATTTASVTLTTGQSKVQSFAGAYVATAKISGILFLDEFPKNDTYDGATLEDALKVAGVTLTLEGGAVATTTTTTTDATGAYAFTALVPGTYRVTITPPAAPTGVAYGGTSTSSIVTLAPGGTATVNFPFDIIRQYVTVAGFLGTDNVKPGITPISGWKIDLYDTQANAQLGGAGGKLNAASVTTNASGIASFNFLRTADKSPNAAVSDQIVYARAAGTNADGSPDATYTLSGERIIEIKYSTKDSVVMAPDTLDALYGQIYLKIQSKEIDGDTLKGWTYEMRTDKDSIGGGSSIWTDFTSVTTGWVKFNVDLGTLASLRSGAAAVFPDTLWFHLAAFQAGAGTHAWTQAQSANRGTAVGSYMRFIWDGTVAAGDTIILGETQVRYSDTDVTVRIHRELDDSTGTTALYSSGDGFDDVALMALQLYEVKSDGTKVVGPAPFNVAVTPAVGTGLFTFTNLSTAKTWEVRGRSTHGGYKVLNDTVVAVSLDASDQTYTDTKLKGTAGSSTFAYKSKTNMVAGNALANDLTAAQGIIVTMTSPNNIQGTPTVLDTTDAAGAYSFANVIEGPYTVTVAGVASTWDFVTKLTTTSVPTVSGAVNNTSATEGTRDIAGYGVTATANFEARRLDTTIKGTVINDRDADGNVIDIDEALAGAQLQLYRDGSGAAFTRDTLITTATTDANGAYSFTGLAEGRYMVRWVGGTPASPSLDVLRALSTDSVIVTTKAAVLAGNPDNSRNIGTTTPATLPRWDYNNSAGIGALANPTHFMFLYKNTKAIGTVKTGGGVAIAGMTVSLRRCNVSAGATSPPTTPGPQTCTSYLGTTVNVVSDASGAFTFDNLTEGIYEIRPQPTTVAGWNTSTPSTTLYLLVGNGDIESLNFVIA
jgi:copper chaperone CopZ